MIDGNYQGLGISVQMDDGAVKVVSPFKGSPADKAGLKAGDYITHIDGKLIYGLELDEAVKQMRGPAGSPVKLSTGVMVIYADDESFTFMTPEGHTLSAWITFSAYRDGELTVLQAQALERTSDPFDELAYMLGGNRMNDRFWRETLSNVAKAMGNADPRIDTQIVCIDKRRQWQHAEVDRSIARRRRSVLVPLLRPSTGRQRDDGCPHHEYIRESGFHAFSSADGRQRQQVKRILSPALTVAATGTTLSAARCGAPPVRGKALPPTPVHRISNLLPAWLERTSGFLEGRCP